MAFGILCSEDWAPSKGARHISCPPPASMHRASTHSCRPSGFEASPFAGFPPPLLHRCITLRRISADPAASKHRGSTHFWRPSGIEASGFHTFLATLLHRCIRLPHIPVAPPASMHQASTHFGRPFCVHEKVPATLPLALRAWENATPDTLASCSGHGDAKRAFSLAHPASAFIPMHS